MRGYLLAYALYSLVTIDGVTWCYAVVFRVMMRIMSSGVRFWGRM